MEQVCKHNKKKIPEIKREKKSISEHKKALKSKHTNIFVYILTKAPLSDAHFC